jgi:hypothetical protein
MTGIAYATTSTNPLGADAGISVFDGDDDTELAREDVALSLDAEDGSLDRQAADALLKGMGFERIEGWRHSGGQWAAEVDRI